ncbi:MAG: hypothetical protein QME77_11520 [bacterium]|nr:hypothetical protein [bacterium]
MHKTMVYLSERQRAALARHARARGQPMAAVVREALDRLLAEPGSPPRSRLLGVAAGPTKAPVSEQVEDLLKSHLRGRRPK